MAWSVAHACLVAPGDGEKLWTVGRSRTITVVLDNPRDFCIRLSSGAQEVSECFVGASAVDIRDVGVGEHVLEVCESVVRFSIHRTTFVPTYEWQRGEGTRGLDVRFQLGGKGHVWAKIPEPWTLTMLIGYELRRAPVYRDTTVAQVAKVLLGGPKPQWVLAYQRGRAPLHGRARADDIGLFENQRDLTFKRQNRTTTREKGAT